MVEQLNEMAWDDPIVPSVPDTQWEAHVKKRVGAVADLYKRLSPLPWLREATLDWEQYLPDHVPGRLYDIQTLVTSQENACRYCYGSARAILRLRGYSERMINRIEMQTRMAELDDKEQAFVLFCRALARSNPRPAKIERDRLQDLGFSREAVGEIAFMIASYCFVNRVATFLACPPERKIERFAFSPLGRMVGLASSIFRKSPTAPQVPAPGGASAGVDNPFGVVIQALEPLPAARKLEKALAGMFASGGLSHQMKILIFAVVAKALDCRFCVNESQNQLIRMGMPPEELDQALRNFNAPSLEPHAPHILAWARETVHYDVMTVQKQTRQLAEKVPPETLLEAIGVASMANAVVRLGMLLD